MIKENKYILSFFIINKLIIDINILSKLSKIYINILIYFFKAEV